MKKCPKCQKTYNDDQNFCFDDASQLVPVGEADTPTMYVPNESLPPTQMITPQQMQNWQQPTVNVNPPSGFNPPLSGFNAPPFTPPQNQPIVGRNNKLAWVGLYLLIGAGVLTIFAIGFKSLRTFGYCSYSGSFCSNGTLGVITILVTGAAFLCGVIALILRFTKPQNFGRKILSLCVGLISGLLFFFQLIFIGVGYSDAKSYASSSSNYNYNYNRSNSSNYSNVSSSPTPVSLDRAILGMWREDGTSSTITFYADKSMLIDNAGSTTTGTYQVNGTTKVAFLKNGIKFQESTIIVTGNKMTMDGTKFTKVN